MTKAPAIDDQFTDMLRRLIREEVRPIIREEVPAIVQAETIGMREDISLIKQVQTQQASQLKLMNGKLAGLTTAVRANTNEVYRLAVLMEELYASFEIQNEAFGT